MNEHCFYFDRFAVFHFWRNFLCSRAPRKPHKPEIETPKFGSYVMRLLKIRTSRSMKQSNSFKITALFLPLFSQLKTICLS